jgi:hypothetical protein
LGASKVTLVLARQGQQLADDLARRARRDLAAAQVAALLAGPRVEHAQVVVDLGHRADGRARVRRRRLLLDGDGGRQAADLVVLGLFQLAQKLARVGRQRLDVAALALGIQRVEGQRRLARPGHPGKHDELALGDRQLVDVQVVLARAANDDEIGFFGATLVLHFRAEGLLEEIGDAQGTDDEIARCRRASRLTTDQDVVVVPECHAKPKVGQESDVGDDECPNLAADFQGHIGRESEPGAPGLAPIDDSHAPTQREIGERPPRARGTRIFRRRLKLVVCSYSAR